MFLCFFSSCAFKVPQENPIRVITAKMFAALSMAFELSSYVAKLAHHFAEAPFPPPTRTRTGPFNRLVLEFLDVEAEHGEDSDRDDNPSC